MTAIITEPIIMKGARTTSLMSMATATCSWFMSPESLVKSEGVPKSSNCSGERALICLNSAFLTSVPKPCEQREANIWHTRAKHSPAVQVRAISPEYSSTNFQSAMAMPLSIISAINSGMNNSSTASTSLQKGPMISSFL